jgi:hypothetical protein
VKFKSIIGRSIGKPLSVAEALAGRSTKWIAEKFGVSESTARRWRSGRPSHRGGPPAGESSRHKGDIMGSAGTGQRRKIAATAMRGASAVNVGKVGVESDTGEETGTRRVGVIQLGTEGRDLMRQAADALERGDYATAERLHDQAILHADGRDYGPLHITDYGPGFNYI